jgi:hypothetical protein
MTNKNTGDRPVAPKLGIFDIFFPISYYGFSLLQRGNESNKCGMGKVIMKDLVPMFFMVKPSSLKNGG